MTRDNLKRGNELIEEIAILKKDILLVENSLAEKRNLYVIENCNYVSIHANEELRKDFYGVVLMGLQNRKAKLEKELEDL